MTGEKLTDGQQMKIFLSAAEREALQQRAAERSLTAKSPVSMAQVLREIIRHGLGLQKTNQPKAAGDVPKSPRKALAMP